MHPSRCRYTKEQFVSLGLTDQWNETKIVLDFDPKSQTQDAVLGQFKNIIKVLYDSSDGSLDNNLDKFVTSNSPAAVQEFVRGVLMCDVQEFQRAPDDETALACLIPRSAQTSGELAPYVQNIQNYISESRAAFMKANTPPSSTKTE